MTGVIEGGGGGSEGGKSTESPSFFSLLPRSPYPFPITPVTQAAVKQIHPVSREGTSTRVLRITTPHLWTLGHVAF